MKVLVVLVLAVSIGCNADPLNADRPKPKLEVMTQVFKDHAMVNANAASRTYRNIRETEFGKAVIVPLEKGVTAAGMIVHQVLQNLPSTTKEILKTSAKASHDLASHVVEDMVKNHLEAMAESVAPVMEKAVGELFPSDQLVPDMVSSYITELMERVDPIFQDIQARLHAMHQSFVKTE